MGHHKHGTPRLHRIGKWQPSTHAEQLEWLGGVIAHVDKHKPKPLHPVLEEFQQLIETNTRVYLLICAMLIEVPEKPQYSTDPTGCPQIRNYKHLLHVLNYLLTTAPSWNDFSHRVGLVGLPINAVLDWSMGTPSGYAAYLDPEINAMLKKVLNAWGEFLTHHDSAAVLDDSANGWFGPTARQDLIEVANLGATSPRPFEEMFVCDPAAQHHGFKSWDAFFTREFREGVRPVASPDDDAVLANACESQPYKLARHVQDRDHFWLKTQPYSVRDMLNHDPFTPQFVGGTIYQAFLSALSYHRWHAPVRGTIVKAYVIDGTYYSEPLYEGIGNPDRDPKHPETQQIDYAGQVDAQEYNTATATRAAIFIEADHPGIGLMCFLGVGMCEVSTCEITVQEGQRVQKGDPLGMFHFGGSTHCLLFRKGVQVEGFPDPGLRRNVPVRSHLAKVQA
ncbi:phosphatidylserine decarboxylase family protein [Aspergillus clavatus NRRL 1]|uniref:Phosphatidylserine decarboxylase family protein n=1 Tax=Aspergillus clavatus (strain ATCC 1007 / CBS 513.65 / DSM 816 / NCTC 3887 / NRRL 1 / QM 1276 / 107) TaxID=344612 RepID=A1CG65_ASPCL|nr:phosphatidylserine decarboxylase family protein [Aspergillus clavatus NRRL 1]EAW10945.1 phosphatidylserine decarboxylase family protein [Aspergillus clavatus NRRL 1]